MQCSFVKSSQQQQVYSYLNAGSVPVMFWANTRILRQVIASRSVAATRSAKQTSNETATATDSHAGQASQVINERPQFLGQGKTR